VSIERLPQDSEIGHCLVDGKTIEEGNLPAYCFTDS